jgi:tetratricopeptide (TPR) repeat protein
MTSHSGQIVTFYSYKGGTGRTMALANLACLLARAEVVREQMTPPRVLAIDWDFEAPGLHRYLEPYLTPQSTARFTATLGCLELFDYLSSARSKFDPANYVGNRLRTRLELEALDLEPYLLATQFPGLSLMKAGLFDDEYPRRVSEFDWPDLFRATFGLFAGVADYLRARFDYILVDSRTGITDTSGICTMLLPDKLVVVFTPNQQSLTGIESLVRKAVAYRKDSPDGRPLTVFPLPSRIEMARPQLLEAWRNGGGSADQTTSLLPSAMLGYQPTFERLFAQIYGRTDISLREYFNEVMLQHVPDYAYGEPVAVVLESGDSRISLSRSYSAFLDRLIELDVPWASLDSARRERDTIRRCDAIATKLGNGEIEESIQLAFGLIELKPPAPLFERAASAVLDVARAAFPRNRATGAALVRESTRLASGGNDIDPAKLGQVLLEAGKLSELFGDLPLATELYESSYANFSGHFGEEHPATLTVLSKLAVAARGRGDVWNRPEYVFNVCRRVLGEEHPDTLVSMTNLAETVRAQGDLAAALRLEEQCLSICRRVFGEEHPITLQSKNNLAEILREKGDLAGARKLEEQVLPISRRVLGEEHPSTLISMSNLAQTLRKEGDLSDARSLLEQVLSIRRRVLGEEHPDTLVSISNLAQTRIAQGDVSGARALQEQALSIGRRVQGEEHPSTLISMTDLAHTLSAQGDLSGARALQEQALSIGRRVQGEEHPSTLISMTDLAHTLSAQGDLSGARALQEQALSISRRVLGEEHPSTLISMTDLAHTLSAQGDLSGARALQEQALLTSQRVLGEEHPSTLALMSDLAHTLSAQGDLSGARALQEIALEVSRRALGSEHPSTLAVMGNLARTLLSMGRLAEAQTVQEEVLATQLRLRGGEKSRYQTILKSLPAAVKEAERLLKAMSAKDVRDQLIISGYGEAMADSAVASAANILRSG